MHEMLAGRPIFAGYCALDQLWQIFQIRGTPTIIDWPEITEMPAFSSQFPQWDKTDLQTLMRNTHPIAVDLID
jgi:hypothetical protein